LVGRYQPKLSNALDKDFLKFLEKAYKLRYASASSPGLAIVINQYRCLMAIGSLVAQIDAGFDLKTDGNHSKTPYQRGIVAGDVHLIEDNVVVTPSLSSGIVQRNNKVFELKVENNYDTLRVEYETMGVNVTGLFSKIPELSVNKQTFVLTRG
jgi:hypothetical protein